MEIAQTELFSVLQEFNPWWSGQPLGDLPDWERSAARPVWEWVRSPESARSLRLDGARQTGKTTIFRQTVRRLLGEGFPPRNILYATFDNPILNVAGLRKTLEAWDALFQAEPSRPRFLFLDEIQYVSDREIRLLHQVDFRQQNRIAAAASASPLHHPSAPSGAGRWETIPLATLSFGEFLSLRGIEVPALPELPSLRPLFGWSDADFAEVTAAARGLTVHFHEYLLRGGFPEPALANDLSQCQRLLREDVVDKVLKGDMTALCEVQRVLEVDKVFLYLCYHDSGVLNLPTVARELEGVKKQTASSFLDLFESTHLIYRLKAFGYGQEVLRGRDKVYLADAALPGAVLLLGRRLLEQPDRLRAAAETAFFKHLFTRYYKQAPAFSHWRDRRYAEYEVDIIAEFGDSLVPFEVKYQGTEISASQLKGLRALLEQRGVDRAYVVTQRWEDFGVVEITSGARGRGKGKLSGKVLKIPAPLACFWLSG